MSKDWTYKNPEDVGINPDKLKELDNALNYQMGVIKNVLITKDDSIIYEKYMQGSEKGETLNVSTVTQSIMSTLIGIAIDRGDIKGVDQKLGDFFPKAGMNAAQITIEDLLTMSVPYTWKGKEPLDRIRRKKNWVEFILSTIGKKKKEEFQFSMGNSHLLSAILTMATGKSTLAFANENLFTPIGMKEIRDQEMKSFSKDEVYGDKMDGWVKDPQGIFAGGWGLSITAEDLARLGRLYVNNGKCDGVQVVSEEWIKKSVTQYYDDSGYSWWIRKPESPLVYMAVGIGGTYMYCIPEAKMVVVILSKLDTMFYDRWELMEEYILPSILG